MATHHSIKTFSAAHPAYTQPSIRNILFKRGAELEKAGAILHLGRKVVIVAEKFLEAMESGTVQRQQTAKRKQAA